MSYDQVAMLVSDNNFSGQSNELIICLIYKESTFNPNAGLPGNQSATGLMGVTDAASTDLGINWDHLKDPQINIATGTAYLGARIHWNHGNVKAGLAGYGTGPTYAESLLNCEKCLIHHSGAAVSCKTRDCLEPLHPKLKPKPAHPRHKRRR